LLDCGEAASKQRTARQRVENFMFHCLFAAAAMAVTLDDLHPGHCGLDRDYR
jgi:hypothetical protein